MGPDTCFITDREPRNWGIIFGLTKVARRYAGGEGKSTRGRDPYGNKKKLLSMWLLLSRHQNEFHLAQCRCFHKSKRSYDDLIVSGEGLKFPLLLAREVRGRTVALQPSQANMVENCLAEFRVKAKLVLQSHLSGLP